MRKVLKVFFVVLGTLVGIIVFDATLSKVLDRSPFLKITENYNDGNILKRDIGIFTYTYVFASGEKVTIYRWEKYSPPVDTSNGNDEMEEEKNMNVIINNQKYHVILENNETVKEFLNLLPQEFTMEELNGNEKYVYIDETLPTNATNPNHIMAGDIMLYGDHCIVIFYKSFDTSYRYTKIGYIDELPDIGNGSIHVRFEK